MTNQKTEYHGVFSRQDGGYSAYVYVRTLGRRFLGAYVDIESAARAVNAKLVEMGQEPRNDVAPGPIKRVQQKPHGARIVSNTAAALRDFRKYQAMKEFNEELRPIVERLERQIKAEARKRGK